MAWTKQKMIERIRTHHPHLGETEIIERLNYAKDIFSELSEIYDKQDSSITTVANKTYYTLPQSFITVDSVWLNGVKIPRLLQKPAIDDPETTSEV